MKIKFIPQRGDSELAVSVSGDTIIINGKSFDLSNISDTSKLPASAVDDKSVAGVIERVSGSLRVTILLPYGINPTINPMDNIEEIDISSGNVDVPGKDSVQPAIISVGNIDWSMLTNEPSVLTQFQLDQNRYKKRAEVQSELMSWMAADNMSRVRSGTWSVSQLTGLLSDPSIQSAQTYMSTLSYELAAQAIASATTPLMTPEIKATWIAKLQDNFFLG